jgi:hypothetical protein
MSDQPKQLPLAGEILTAYKDVLYMLAQAGTPQEDVVRLVRRDYQRAALYLCRGNRCKAAELIHTHRNNIYMHQKETGEG